MTDPILTRRELLKVSAAVGAAALAGHAGAQVPAAGPAPSSPGGPGPAPDGRAAPTIGIALGPEPLATGDLDKLFDDLRARAGVNALFPFIYTYVASTAGMGTTVNGKPFRGGNFAMPHMEYYKDVPLTFEEMRAPEFGTVDAFARAIPIAKKHGMKMFAWVLEDNRRAPFPKWEALYEMDFHGRRMVQHPGGPCYNHPTYQAFVLGLVEDYVRSYDVAGVMWSSERQGGLWNALGAYHNGARADPGQATCFCEFCTKRGKEQGIDVDRAKQGFAALESYVRAGRAKQRPRDGYFVSFFRLLLQYPELLAWESLWMQSRWGLQRKIYGLVKSIKPELPVGWHLWHNISFSPFHRAEMDFGEMAAFSNFLKPVLYSNVAGERIRSFTDSACGNVFGDLPADEALGMLYHVLDYKEAPFDRVRQTGLSADYVERETRRTFDDANALAAAGNGHKVDVWPGIDIDVPVGAGSSRCTPESVKAAVIGALRGGATGVILSRNYAEMKPENLAGAGAALDELKLR
jgi:hypothetical protein